MVFQPLLSAAGQLECCGALAEACRPSLDHASGERGYPSGDLRQRTESNRRRGSGGLPPGIRDGLLPCLLGMAGLRFGFRRSLGDWTTALQVDPESQMRTRPRSNVPWHVAGALALLAATLTASRVTAYRRSEALTQPLDSIGREIQGFRGVDNPPLDERVLGQLKCSSYLSRTYVKNGVQAELGINPKAGSSPVSTWANFCWSATRSSKTARRDRSYGLSYPTGRAGSSPRAPSLLN